MSSSISSQITDVSSLRDIKYLTIQGGGMKGIGYVGAIDELEKQGILAQIKEVAGSSVGGLIATLLAVGCTAEEIKAEMVGIDFKIFQDKKEPGFWESTFSKKVEVIDDISSLAFGSSLGLWEGDAIRYWLSSIIARKTGNPKLTFKELESLTNIPGSNFKKLILTGSDLSNKELKYFNVNTDPDLPIVEAARISAGFPFGYKTISRKGKKDKEEVLIDGGLLENLPDIFNKYPYINEDGLNKEGANPKVFALGFKESDKKTSSKIKKTVELGAAIVKTKMSNLSSQKKYGDNIVLIDTVGMQTLEFDASEEKRNKLVESGNKAAKDSIAKILKKEQSINYDYHKLSIRELVRKEIAIHNMIQNGDYVNLFANGYDFSNLSEEEIKEKQKVIIKEKQILLAKEIQKRLSANKVSHSELEFFRKQEHDRLEKIIQNKFTVFDEETLVIICENKIVELSRIKEELLEKINKLQVSKDALKYTTEQVLDYFHKDSIFRQELEMLSNQQRKIDETFELRIALNLNVNLSAAKKEQQINLLEHDCDVLQQQKNKCLTDLINKYNKDNNESLGYFFSNLLEDSDKIDFYIPNKAEQIETYLNKKIGLNSQKDKADRPEHNVSLNLATAQSYPENSIEYSLTLAKNELDKVNKELESFSKQRNLFINKKEIASSFSELVKFKNELDKNIKSKTTPLVKLNNFLVSKAPRLKKIITPFLQATAFFSFASWLPVAAPVVGIAKTVEYFSKDKNTKTTAKSIANYFSCTDLKLNDRLRKFRDVSSKILESNQAEQYLPKLYDHYFNGTNLDKDDFLKKIEDTSKLPNLEESNSESGLGSDAFNERVLNDNSERVHSIDGASSSNNIVGTNSNSSSLRLLKRKKPVLHIAHHNAAKEKLKKETHSIKSETNIENHKDLNDNRKDLRDAGNNK